MKGWIWVESLLRARARRPAYPAAKPCSRRGGGAWRLYQARSAERLEPWCLCVEAGGSTTTTTTTIIAVFEMDAGSVAARASSRPGRHSECFDGCTEPRSPAAPRRIWRLGVEFSLSRMAGRLGRLCGWVAAHGEQSGRSGQAMVPVRKPRSVWLLQSSCCHRLGPLGIRFVGSLEGFQLSHLLQPSC